MNKNNLGEFGNLLQGFMNQNVATGKPSWYNGFAYPAIPSFNCEDLLNFARIALFFQSLMNNAEPTQEISLETDLEEEEFLKIQDEFFDGLKRLGGRCIYNLENNFYFYSFDHGALALNLLYPKIISINFISNNSNFFEKIKEFSAGYKFSNE